MVSHRMVDGKMRHELLGEQSTAGIQSSSADGNKLDAVLLYCMKRGSSSDALSPLKNAVQLALCRVRVLVGRKALIQVDYAVYDLWVPLPCVMQESLQELVCVLPEASAPMVVLVL